LGPLQHIEQKGNAIEFVQLVSKECQGNFAAFGLALCESFGKMRGNITRRYVSLVAFDAALFSALPVSLFSVATGGHSCCYSAHGMEQLGFLRPDTK
jgi:hypothetical protein